MLRFVMQWCIFDLMFWAVISYHIVMYYLVWALSDLTASALFIAALLGLDYVAVSHVVSRSEEPIILFLTALAVNFDGLIRYSALA